jgi:23S rRNA (adenine2503-C2)-methyltransferase
MNGVRELPIEMPLADGGAAPTSGEAMPRLLGMSTRELQALAASFGEPAYRGRQLAGWIYVRGARSFDEMSDLPRALRDRLDRQARVGRAALADVRASADGTTKLLLQLEDGRRIETVLLPYERRTSVCISSQVGCPVGCVFCATATMGFARDVTAGEMVDQVLAARELAAARGSRPVSHVVVMGMGEPLLNLANTVTAIRLVQSELGISPRRVTISTAGYVPGMRELAATGLSVTLAVSLHAATDDLRSHLIPLSRRYGLESVMEASDAYFQQTGRRVTFEYLLLGGVNDTPEQARALALLAAGRAAHVNLIPWNPAASRVQFNPPTRMSVQAFRLELKRRGIIVTQRAEKGQDIAAACGQLVVSGQPPQPAPSVRAA